MSSPADLPPASRAPSTSAGVDSSPDLWSTGRLFSAVARRIEQDWNAHLAQWDLNHASQAVLYLLARGPLSQRALALASGVTEQTMSRILARMERQGYVERLPGADRRRHDVHLTESGRAALLEGGDPAYAEAMTLRGLDDEQAQLLRELLLAMIAEHPRPPAAPRGWDWRAGRRPDEPGRRA